MALVFVDFYQNWMVHIKSVASLVLQLGHILVRVEWNDTVIMISRGNEHGGILLLFHILQR